MSEEAKNKDMTKAVLMWLRDSMKLLYKDPSDQNVGQFVAEVIDKGEVIYDAVFNALKPEFRGLAETISGLLVPGVRAKEEGMVRPND